MKQVDRVKIKQQEEKQTSVAVPHANTDPFDSKKGRGVSFRIHKRQERNESVEIPIVDAGNHFYVWQGNNRHLRLRVKVALAVAIAAVTALSIATITVHRSTIIAKAAAYTDGRIFSRAMDVSPDLVAAALNEIDTGDN